RSLSGAFNDAETIRETGATLLAGVDLQGKAVRLLGVGVSNFRKPPGSKPADGETPLQGTQAHGTQATGTPEPGAQTRGNSERETQGRGTPSTAAGRQLQLFER